MSQNTQAKNTRAKRASIPCPYCGELQQAFARHLRRRHADEEEVKYIAEKSASYEENPRKKSAFRKRLFRVLAYEGRAAFNKRVLKEPGQTIADLVPAKRSKKGVTRFHLECPNCHGLFRRLTRHKCPKKKGIIDISDLRRQARCLAVEKMITPSVQISSLLINVLAQIRDGPIKRAIFEDALMLRWADFEVRKHIPDADPSSSEDEEESAQARKARHRRRRHILKSVTYKLRNESRRAIIIKQLRLLSRYVLRYRKKYRPNLTLIDTFRKDYVEYTSRAIKRITADYMNVEQAKKICTWLSKYFKFKTG